jgi:hypothetical protein
MSHWVIVLFVGLFTFLNSTSLADSLRLRDGLRVEGTYLGGDSRTVRFLGENGEVASYAITEVESIAFGGPVTDALARPAGLPPDSMARRADVPVDSIVVPKDTVLFVRMLDAVDSNVNKPGERFRATLDEPLIVKGTVLAAKHSPVSVQLVHVKQSGQLRGEEEIALQLRSIAVDDKNYPVTSGFAEIASEGKGKQTAKVVGGTAGVGAIIGAIAGGKKGAAIGAAAGAGTGVAVQTLRGKQVRVNSETLLLFPLEEPLTIR